MRRVELRDVLAGSTDRSKLQQGWSPQCEPFPAPPGDWGVLKTTAVQPGRFLSTENKRLPDGLGARPQLEVQSGDLLLTNAGPRARCGVPTLVRATRPRLLISGKIYRFRADESLIDSRYLELFLLSDEAQAAIDKMKTGISDSGLNLTKDRFLSLPVPLVAIAEQRRIVGLVEDHLSRLDAAVENLARAERRVASLMAASVEAILPTDVEEIQLGHLALASGYGTSAKCTVDGEGPPVVRIPNVRGRRVDLTQEKRVTDPAVDVSRLMLEPGDLLVVRTNGSRDLIGRTAVVQPGIDASFASYLIRFQLDTDRVSPEWVSLMLERPQARRELESRASSSAGQYNLSLSKLYSITLPVVARGRQDAILASLSDWADVARGVQEAILNSRARAAGLRRSLLAAAFSGKLTGAASDIDRIEEMAS